jgi:hypothetical protein
MSQTTEELIAGEAAREAAFLESTAEMENKIPDYPHATDHEWHYLREIIARAMHLADQVPTISQESTHLYRALQRARVELGNPPESH